MSYNDPSGLASPKQDPLNEIPSGAGTNGGGAVGFSGRSGYEININGSNSATSICELNYSGHTLDRMQGRGIPPSVVENTIRTGSFYTQPHYYDAANNISVILSPTGSTVITVRPGR